MIKFECLPNEILYLCFQFFDALDLFHSFDGLSNRFNQLIRQIPLYFDFHSTRKAKFHQFCRQLSLDDHIKQHVYSLHLSNVDTVGQIDSFLSYFSLAEFPHLQILTLSEIDKKHVTKLVSVLPQMLELRRFDSPNIPSEVLDALPAPKVRALSLQFSHVSCQTSITHLTIAKCSLIDVIYHYFQFLPLLKYLHVMFLDPHSRNMEKSCQPYKSIHLKRLFIGNTSRTFEDLLAILHCTPNLEHFAVLLGYHQILELNTKSWRQSISSILPHLKAIKYYIQIRREYDCGIIIEQFRKFQEMFSREHCPYLVHYELTCGLLIDDIIRTHNEHPEYRTSSFFHCGILISCPRSLKYVVENWPSTDDQCAFYKGKVQFLHFAFNIDWDTGAWHLDNIRYLTMSLDFTYLMHLTFTAFNGKEECLNSLLQLFSTAPHLSSLYISECILYTCTHDHPLYQHLQHRVSKLNLGICACQSPSFHLADDQDRVQRICSIFSNIKHLRCIMNKINHTPYLLDHLTKLCTLRVTMSKYAQTDEYVILKELVDNYDALHKINESFSFGVNCVERTVDIWMN